MTSLIHLLAAVFGFRVIARYGDAFAVHHCFSLREALEWAACYPQGARLTVLDGGAVLMQRFGGVT